MTKDGLIKSLIKPIIKKIVDEKQKEESWSVIKLYPQVLLTLEQLMGPEYKFFIKDIHYVSPKPSTFKVVLLNDQYFFISWYQETFEAQVSGKRYYLLKIQEQERATLAISELLKYGTLNDIKDSFGGEDFGGSSSDFESEEEEIETPEDLEGL